MDLVAPRRFGATVRARADVLPWWAEALAIGSLSRVYSLVLIGLAAMRAERLAPGLWPEPLAIWDGGWYLRIAAFGYHAAPIQGYQDFAFFPLWPFAIRLFSLGGLIPLGGSAFVLANISFLVASVMVFRIFSAISDRSSARVGVALLAFGPGAYIFTLAYSESMFVLLAAASLCTFHGRRAVFIVLAQLTRLTGVALTLGALAEGLRHRDPRQGLLVLIGGVALLAWWVFIWALTGDPVGYMRGTPSWQRATTGFPSVLEGPYGMGVLALGYVLVMLWGSVRLIRAGRTGLGIYGVAIVASAIMFGGWSDMPRYAMAAFPANVAIAELMPTARSRVLLVVLFAALQAAWVVAVYSGFTP
jgi:hypothetical protein